MPNHGYCKNCWWWKRLTGESTNPNIIMSNLGKCYMQSSETFEYHTTEQSYCPDYLNRKKGNKKQTLDEWLISIDYENNI